MLCNKDQHFYPALALEICKAGFNSFRFDFAGNGESQGNPDDCTVTKETRDIESVAEYFKDKGYEIYCLIGHSRGAVDVLLHQYRYASAKKVVEIAGVVDQRSQTTRKFSKKDIATIKGRGFVFLDLFGNKLKVTRKYFFDRAKYGNIGKSLRKIAVPVLVVHGTDDKENPVSNAKMMMIHLNSDSRLALIRGADHFFFKASHKTKLFRSVVNFLGSMGSKGYRGIHHRRH